MSLFQNAHGFTLSQPYFIDQSNHITGPKSGIDILLESSAPEAVYDSYSRRYAPLCFPGTREQHIEDITGWASSPSDPTATLPIFRMNGPAGVGKSAIAQSCADKLDGAGILGASFFFTSDICDDHTRFFPTIAYQLSTKLADYRQILDRKISVDPTLVKKQLRYQFRDLITRPLRELEESGKKVGTYVILVDGLDECKDRDAQREIVEIIAEGISLSAIPFRWAIFSRAEPQIEAAFTSPNIAAISQSVSLPVSREIDGEIELYLRNGLQNALRRQNIQISAPWPSDQDLRALVEKADGLFIYAATVVRLVGQAHLSHDPMELMRAILGTVPRDQCGPKHPMAELDAFYILILQRIPSALLPDIQLLLYSLVIMKITSLQLASYTLGFSKTKILNLCGHLSAVSRLLATPEDTGLSGSEAYSQPSRNDIMKWLKESPSKLVYFSLHHKSFRDFLLDPNRSRLFYSATHSLHEIAFKRLIKSYSDWEPKIAIHNNRPKPIFDSPEMLPWSLDLEIDSLLVLVALYIMGRQIMEFAFCPDRLDRNSFLLTELVDFNYQKHLLCYRWWFPDRVELPGRMLGIKYHCQFIEEVLLRHNSSPGLSQFRMDRFQTMLTRLEEHNVIRRYYPKSTSLELPLFRIDSQGRLISGLYTKGHGDRSTFWYFYFSPKLDSYSDFESMNLAEGEQRYREVEWEMYDWESDETHELVELDEPHTFDKPGGSVGPIRPTDETQPRKMRKRDILRKWMNFRRT